MAQQPINTPAAVGNTQRVAIACVCPGVLNEEYRFRLSQVTETNLRKVFGIAADVQFFLVDKDQNVELPAPSGVFPAVPNTRYQVRWSQPMTIRNASPVNNSSGQSSNVDAKQGEEEQEQNEVNWTQAKLMDLSKGSGGAGGQTVYTATNGVTVTSSAPTFSSPNNCYIQYLFNGDIAFIAHNSYWMTNSSGDQTLTINFGHWTKLAQINIAAITLGDDYPDRRSNYSIDAWVQDQTKWIKVVDLVDTEEDKQGAMRSHCIRKCVSQIRINLTREKQNGVCLKEIDFYVV